MSGAREASDRLDRRYRALSAVEAFVGTLLVIGHNVLAVLPNEVWLLGALFVVSFKLRDGGWRSTGLVRPASWRNVIVLALVAAAALHVGSELVVQPLAHRIWPQPERASSLLEPAMDARRALVALAIVWSFAAFGEECGYRGYLLNRVADVANRSPAAYIGAMVYVAVLFGLGHYYKGPAGVVDSTWSGLVLGGVYLVARRNLWAPILAHGFADTFAVVVVYAGLAD